MADEQGVGLKEAPGRDIETFDAKRYIVDCLWVPPTHKRFVAYDALRGQVEGGIKELHELEGIALGHGLTTKAGKIHEARLGLETELRRLKTDEPYGYRGNTPPTTSGTTGGFQFQRKPRGYTSLHGY